MTLEGVARGARTRGRSRAAERAACWRGAAKWSAGPAVAVWAASFGELGGDGAVTTFHAAARSRLAGGERIDGLPEDTSAPRAVIMIPDPYSFPARPRRSLQIADDSAGRPVLGGLSSARHARRRRGAVLAAARGSRRGRRRRRPCDGSTSCRASPGGRAGRTRP